MPNISIISECIPCSRIYPRRTARGRTLCTTSWACRSSEPARKSSTSAKWRLCEDPRQIYRPGHSPVAPSGASVMGGMPLLRESARINRDKEGLRKQRPHATVASPPSVRPRDVRRLLELLLHLAAIGGALQRQSIAEGLRVRTNVNARGDDSYCSEHCVAPTRVVGEHGLSGSGRRLASVTAKRYARWTRPTGADVIGPGKVSHIHSTTRFPFRDMATVIEISRSGESTRGHAATRNEHSQYDRERRSRIESR